MADSLDALLSRASPGRQASAGRRAAPPGSGLPSGSSGSYGSSASGMGSMGPPVTRSGSISGGQGTPHSTPARQGSATRSSADPYATPSVARSDSFGSSSSSLHNRTSSGVSGSSNGAFGGSTSFSGGHDLSSSQTIGSDVRHGRRAGSAVPKRPELGRENSGPSGPPTPSHATSAPSPSHAASSDPMALRNKMRASINDPLPQLGGNSSSSSGMGERVARQSSASSERPLPGASSTGSIPAGAGEAPGEPTLFSATAATGRQGSATRAAPPVQCPDCGRKFKRTSFIIHQRACKRVFRTKRAAFDAQQARIKDTAAAAYVNKANGIHTEDTESDSDDGKGGKKTKGPRVLDEGDIRSDGDDDDEPDRPKTAKKPQPVAVVEAKKVAGGPLVVISKKTGKASTVLAAESKTQSKGSKGEELGRDGKPKWKDQSEKLRQAMKAARSTAKPAAPVLASKTGIDVVKISRTR